VQVAKLRRPTGEKQNKSTNNQQITTKAVALQDDQLPFLGVDQQHCISAIIITNLNEG